MYAGKLITIEFLWEMMCTIKAYEDNNNFFY